MHDQNTGKNSQTLTIFVMASDDDGVDDMDKMYVINDEHQLYWEISGKDLRLEKYGENELWMGSNFITMPIPEDALPSGTYRIMLLDSSGERAKTSVVINNNIKGAPDKWPTLTKGGEGLRVDAMSAAGIGSGIILAEILVVHVAAPAVLTLLFASFMRKKGWIQPGDLKLDI